MIQRISGVLLELVSCAAILLAGCTGNLPGTSDTLPAPTATRTLQLSPSPTGITPKPSSTKIITPPSTGTPQPTIVDDDAPVLRFVFPTPRAAPISAWRPPLYEVPWALTPYDHFYFSRPIAADVVNWPLADYRYGAIWPGMEDVIHTGIDIDAPEGTPVLAAAAGEVVWVGFGLVNGAANPDDPYGMAIMIKHDFGYQGDRLESVYAHLSETDVVLGQEVSSGEKIGLVGNTGLTTGPHLHFEIRVEYSNYYYTTRNPELWLVPPQGWGVLVGHIMENEWTPLFAQDVYVKSLNDGDTWLVRTYADSPALHDDDYYQENLVLSDLPEGSYGVSLSYEDTTFRKTISIHPGMVTYLSFTLEDLFSTAQPVIPTIDFLSTATPANP